MLVKQQNATSPAVPQQMQQRRNVIWVLYFNNFTQAVNLWWPNKNILCPPKLPSVCCRPLQIWYDPPRGLYDSR